ncbi:MAG TPA: cysteine dioxygenase family protein [Rhodanobacteraceae bacterium]|nr:cysteine dioxygenase family protein [Rhodanobacteraceae bacterium]
MQIDFPGRDKLIQSLDTAIGAGNTPAVMQAMRHTLCRLIRDDSVRLPDCVFEANPEHYARRELYHSGPRGYSVMAMTWGPGQGTPIHDHAGMWCVEGVWHGELEVVQYELVERHDQRFHFRPAGVIQAGPGSAGSLIPPHEYHTIRNPAADAITVSLHVYQDRMTRCAVFEPLGGEWYARGERALVQDAA